MVNLCFGKEVNEKKGRIRKQKEKQKKRGSWEDIQGMVLLSFSYLANQIC